MMNLYDKCASQLELRGLFHSTILTRIIRKRTNKQKNALLMISGTILAALSAAGSRPLDLRCGRRVLSRPVFNPQDHIRIIGEDLFRRLYRLTTSQFVALLASCKPYLQPKVERSTPISATVSAEVKVLVTMRILAGASYLDIGWPYGIGRATTYSVFRQTLSVLDIILPKFSFPQTEEECTASATLFQHKRNSPIRGIVSAIDGIAIEIMQPRSRKVPDARKYFNRKGFYSLCVQAAVGAYYKFYFVSARHAGGTHDSTAFQATKLHDLLQGTVLPEWASIAADDAYSNGSHILTPYSGSNLSMLKDTFNFYLSSCRIAVEQAFGTLVRRFGIFWSALRYDIHIDTLIIMVTCKLHNFIIDTSNDDCFASTPLAEENNVLGSPTIHPQDLLHTEQNCQRSRQRRREQSAIRDRIAERLHSLGFMRPRPCFE